MQKVAHTIIIIIVAAVIFFGQRWYTYVNNKTSPYDDVGIQINSALPSPVRKWGCDKLHANFAAAVPPYGCQAADGKSWM